MNWGDKYKGNIHKFDHQMNTQNGISNLTLLYFDDLSNFLKHLPAQTTLVVVETFDEGVDLRKFMHPLNAKYIFGRKTTGITKDEVGEIKNYLQQLNKDIPEEFVGIHSKTANLEFIRLETPNSLNLGVCAAIIMYDRHCKLSKKTLTNRLSRTDHALVFYEKCIARGWPSAVGLAQPFGLPAGSCN